MTVPPAVVHGPIRAAGEAVDAILSPADAIRGFKNDPAEILPTAHGKAIPGGSGTSKMEFTSSNNDVYGQDSTSGQWYLWNQTDWTTTSPPPAAGTSPDNTVLLLGSTAAIVDSRGQDWTITSGGQIAINGKTDASTANVTELAWEKGVMWQENASGH